MAKRKIKTTGYVIVSDTDLDGRQMTDMRFWDQFCPEGTVAESVSFYWEAGYYDEPDSFRAIIDWKVVDTA